MMQLSYLPTIMNRQHVSHCVTMQKNSGNNFASVTDLWSSLQTYTAVYYVMADLLMLGMFMYYKVKNKMNQGAFLWVIVSLIESAQCHCRLSSDRWSPEPD